MHTEIHHSTEVRNAATTPLQYPPLESESRATLPTMEAAFHLNRAEQTLRIWACREDGPIRPIRVNGRLAWPVSEIKRILGVSSGESHV